MLIGSIEEYPLGFLLATVESMLEQADGELIGVIRFIYVDHDAREVGVAEVMRDQVLAELRLRGISRFDAHVLPRSPPCQKLLRVWRFQRSVNRDAP